MPTVLALDYDGLAVAHLVQRYPGLAAVRANLAVLPVADASIDTVVSLQVIEHVWDHSQFLAECARVLRPGGLLMLQHAQPADLLPRSGQAAEPLSHP